MGISPAACSWRSDGLARVAEQGGVRDHEAIHELAAMPAVRIGTEPTGCHLAR